MTAPHVSSRDVAIVGMSLRFPGADTVDEFWQNLRNGVESITVFSDAELRTAGVPESMISEPSYVKAQPILKDIEYFDAAFFGYKPREAEAMDPQVRLFLECAWEALERAGYDPDRYRGAISVYGGNNISNYFIFHVLPVMHQLGSDGSVFGIVSYNDKDALATAVSHKLNLRGPSLSVQTFCSTSLVAVHLACQSLIAGESDMALAGGVSLIGNQVGGYYYEEGGIRSPDGHNRTFDARGKGTVFGNGVGIVVLKRLADAVADRDVIHAVIRGSAVNNDGSQKAAFTAPSVDGQAEAIRQALLVSGVHPESIGYVETHGTATPIGDPIEVEAMTKAYRSWTTRTEYCPIGSVKTNFGHLDRAAGVAGLIKTALVLEHRQIPPTLHYDAPNPKIDFEHSPFFVNATLRDFPASAAPRRAAVSSLGIGGTNAHAILEEAPARPAPAPSRPSQLIVVSARSAAALDQATERLAKFLRQSPDASLPDVAYTLQIGRRAFQHRRAVVGSDASEVLHALETRDRGRVFSGAPRSSGQPVAFLFPGQGAQYVKMAAGLYDAEPEFRRHVDGSCDLLLAQTGWDLRSILYPSREREAAAAAELRQTRVTQPALFVTEYALARLWMSWGIVPVAMLGHSIGEYVAACLSGVMTLEQALKLVAARGALMQELPSGAMLAVPLPEDELGEYLNAEVSVAAVNAERSCVLAGPAERIAGVELALSAAGVEGRRLQTSHAFHSVMMDPLLETFERLVSEVPLQAPTIPYVSNVTGDWVTAAQTTDPAYWAQHLRRAVRFADGVATLMSKGEVVPLEVGPGRTLTQLVRQHAAASVATSVTTIRAASDSRSDLEVLLAAVGQLWTAGVEVDWDAFWTGQERSRVVLPTYPFERQKYWLDATTRPAAAAAPAPVARRADLADWFYAPTWKRSAMPSAYQPETAGRWLVLTDGTPLADDIIARLRAAGQGVVSVSVSAAEAFEEHGDGSFAMSPARREDWTALLNGLERNGAMPDRILSLWNIASSATDSPLDRFDAAQDRGFFSLLYLSQALGDRSLPAPVDIGVVTNALHNVTGEPFVAPERATLLGPCRVIGKEYPDITCRNIDVASASQEIAAQVLAEMGLPAKEPVVAYRGGYRWTPSYERLRLEAAAEGATLGFRDRGVYLITGGLGGLGLAIAEHLAETFHARLALVGVSRLPDEPTWPDWLAAHDEDDRTSRRIRAIERMREKGGEVLVIHADASRLDQMSQAVEDVERRFGAIDGVLHAAGVAGDGVMQLKTRAVANSVIAPKAKGALVIDQLFRGRPLDFVLLFSSTAAILGGFGQADYCGANSLLDVLATGSDRGTGWPLLSINWDAWSEVGMAVETQQRATAILSSRADGFTPIAHPYFERQRTSSDSTVLAGTFSSERLWFLNEHRLYGQPTLPSTAYLELARSAFAPIAGDQDIELRDVFFLKPCAVPEGQQREVECVLTRDDEEHEFVIRSRGSEREAWTDHCRGRLLAVAPGDREPRDLGAIEAECNERRLDNPDVAWADIADRIGQVGEHLGLGPRWLNLQTLFLGRDRELMLQSLKAPIASDVEVSPLHPALIDFTALLPLHNIGALYIPFSFDCVRVMASLPGDIATFIVNKDDMYSRKETLGFDATVMDRSGRPLVEIEGMTLRRIDQGRADLAARAQTSAAPASEPAADSERANFRLVMSAPGMFSGLEMRPAPRRAPDRGQVEIEVACAGLNFKDVLRALGMIPGMKGGDVSDGFGSECAGRVTRVGEGVSGLAPGDDVLAIAPSAFGAFTLTFADLVVPMPAGIGFAQAAAIPLVFLTAYHALVNQARLAKGERVLIHAAAGGVGLAAIQIARHIGAEIFATAGSPAKHEYLKSLGVEHVASSRALSFADDIRAWTGGEGVDVVLNSLAGEFIPASLALLKPYGRFVEIGARDIYENAPLGLRPFANNLTFSAIDLGPMFVERSETVRGMFLAILQHMQRGEYRPLPVQTFTVADAERAFEFMAAARQIGKIAIEMQPMVRGLRRDGLDAGAAASSLEWLAGAPSDLGERIAPPQGIEALTRVLGTRHPQVVVSPRDLVGLLEWQSQAMKTLQDSPPTVAAPTRIQMARPDLSTPFVAPRSEAETTIAAVWCDLLGLQQVGIHDSFFELGGDSLIGVQVLSRIRKAFNVQLPSSVLYEGPTVESLAALAAGTVVESTEVFAQQRGRAEKRRERQQQRRLVPE